MKISSLILTLSTLLATAVNQMVFEPPFELIQSVEAAEATETSDKFLNFDSTDVETVTYGDPSPGSSDTGFYNRANAYKIDVESLLEEGEQTDLFYSCGTNCAHTYDEDEASISFPLKMGCNDTDYLAAELTFKMWFYQDGISRIMIGEPGNKRFRISQ